MLHIYKASAGSGKTYRLALDYIKLLLGEKVVGADGTSHLRLRKPGSNAHRSIMAMTFTNKATDEMKRRIMHELAVLAHPMPGMKGSNYTKDLTDALGCTKEQLSQAAGEALRDLTVDFGAFNISTIDSFFQRVLRTFAREANVMGDFTVNIRDKDVLTQAVTMMLAELNRPASTDPQLTQWLYEYQRDKLEEGKSFSLFNDKSGVRSGLISFIDEMSNERFWLSYDDLMEYLRRTDRPLVHFRKSIKDAARRAEQSIKALAIRGANMVESNKGKGLNGRVCGIWAKIADEGADSKTLFDQKSFKAFKTGNIFNKDRDDAALRADFEALAEEVEQKFRLALTLQMINKNLYVLGVVEAVYRCIDRMHRDTNSIQLSNTNTLLSSIIGDDDAPFIYERMAMHLRHFLLDEFQDTSEMQWRNLLPLVADSHASGHDNLIIGDVKQSIYRFRNADPSLLHTKVQQEFIRRDGGSKKRISLTGDTVEQNTNWRSSATVVRFNNTLFNMAALSPANRLVYKNVTQQVSPKHTNHTGYVSVRFINAGALNAAAEAADPDTNVALKYDDYAIARTIAEVDRQLRAGYAPKDIAVLTFKNDHAGKVIEALIDHVERGEAPVNYTVISDDALKVSMSPAVRKVITRLRFINSDDLPLRSSKMTQRIFRSLFDQYERELSVCPDPGEALAAAVRNAHSIYDNPDIAKSRSDDDDTILATDLGVIIERLIGELTQEERARQSVFITAFVDLVADYIDYGLNDINSFLKWWDQIGSKAKISSPESDDAIRVMTVHKSKGLEFKCVHLPFINKKFDEVRGARWFDSTKVFGTAEALDPRWIGADAPFDNAEILDIVPPMVAMDVSKETLRTTFGDEAQRYIDENEIDVINQLYVALTRAVDELIVTIDDTKDTRSNSDPSDPFAHNTTAFMRGALRKMVDLTADDNATALYAPVEHDPETDTYTAGRIASHDEYTANEHCPENDALPEQPNILDPTETIEMLPYKVSSRPELWRDTTLDNIPDVDLDVARKIARSRGRRLHRALQYIATKADIPRAVSHLVVSGDLPRKEKRQYVDLLDNILSDSRVAPWFEGYEKVLAEQPVYIGAAMAQEIRDTNGEASLTRRPDRVVWTADGHIDIIDYKSGSRPDNPERLKAHLDQVRGYREMLRAATATTRPIRAFVWYISSSDIVNADTEQ